MPAITRRCGRRATAVAIMVAPLVGRAAQDCSLTGEGRRSRDLGRWAVAETDDRARQAEKLAKLAPAAYSPLREEVDGATANRAAHESVEKVSRIARLSASSGIRPASTLAPGRH